MKDLRFRLTLFTLTIVASLPLQAQQPLPAGRMPGESSSLSMPVGAEVQVSTLGPGIEVGTGLSQHLNLRVGGNFFNYNLTSTRDSVNYSGDVRLHTTDAHLDWFPFGGNFHIGPGLLYYFAQPLSAKLAVPGGTSFSLGNANFISSTANPVTGAAGIHLHRMAPAITAGVGNLVARRAGKHWSFPFEVGAAFQGQPKILLGLQGTACIPHSGCYNAATDPHVLGPLQQEIQKRESDISWFKVYPMISMGVGYRF